MNNKYNVLWQNVRILIFLYEIVFLNGVWQRFIFFAPLKKPGNSEYDKKGNRRLSGTTTWYL